MSSTHPERAIVAEFHKTAGGRLKLRCIMVAEPAELSPLATRFDSHRTGYDVEWSRNYGYIWSMCSCGGSEPIEVSGIYFSSGEVQVREGPTRLVDRRDSPPWKSRRTLAVRKRNRTRRLARLPKAFRGEREEDLIDWMERNAIEDEAVWCPTCRDWLPAGDLCEHIWWCARIGDYSCPSDRCGCRDREECRSGWIE